MWITGEVVSIDTYGPNKFPRLMLSQASRERIWTGDTVVIFFECLEPPVERISASGIHIYRASVGALVNGASVAILVTPSPTASGNVGGFAARIYE